MSEIAQDMSIGQLAERTGLSVHTLRFYEREGLLLHPVRRGPGGRRVYSDEDARWLTTCIVLRASGMPLPAIRTYTELVRQGTGNETERLTLLREHRKRVTRQMSDLSRCLDLSNCKVGAYEDILAQATATGLPPSLPPQTTTPAPETCHGSGQYCSDDASNRREKRRIDDASD
jgi:DNA-binding transcriptional MerR regulator